MALDKVIDSVKHKAELKSIADSIRAKGKTAAQFKSAAEMKQAIDNISTAKPEETYNRKYTANGKYPITPTSGKTINGGEIEVAVPGKVPVIKPKTITENGAYDAADEGADGYSPLTVNVSGGGGGLQKWHFSSRTSFDMDAVLIGTGLYKGKTTIRAIRREGGLAEDWLGDVIIIPTASQYEWADYTTAVVMADEISGAKFMDMNGNEMTPGIEANNSYIVRMIPTSDEVTLVGFDVLIY